MPSQYWDEKLAARYGAFRYEFWERALAGKTVVVAGGTGGLGAATVGLLAAEGARLVVGYRANRARAERLASAMREQFGAEIKLVAGDIAEAATRKTYLDAVESLGASLEAAAIFPGDPARASLESLDREQMLRSLEANYVGPALLARDLGTAMERSPSGGSVVLLATMQALEAFTGSLNYGPPKAALVHAGRVLAKQWSGVRVNVVAPGATVAGMAEASVSGGKYDSFVASGAIARFGRPEDVARAVRFFLQPDNYVTGEVLLVDGGLTLKRGT
ncbi:MAG: SDR family NAD(P)-dependent oxidoreductase [Candidatus Acidiferrales bacterium]